MRKGFLIVLAVVLVAALAAPAMAGTDISGFYRTKAWMSNFRTGGAATAPTLAKDAPTNAFVEQRFRLKFASGTENVQAVAFFEIDFGAWGDVAGSAKQASTDVTGLGAGRNGGGALGSDRINLETKDVYVWFKLPDTSLDFTVGLQNRTDAYQGLLFGAADMAGIFVNGKYEPVSYTVGWAKLYEFDTAKSEDLSLYIAAAKFAPTKDVKLGFNFYFLQDDTQSQSTSYAIGSGTGALESNAVLVANPNRKKIYIPGIDFAANVGPVTLSGFALYQFGQIEFNSTATSPSDVDVSGYAIDLRGDMNVGPGKAFLEGLYISGSDNVTDKYKGIVTLSDFDASPGGNSAFGRTDMSILLVNADDINCAQSLTGARATPVGWGLSTSPSLGGRGILHFAGGYSQKLGDKLTVKGGAGYLKANNLLQNTTDSLKKGKELGYELNANVNYNIMKGLDFGVYGAYAWLGDYFEFKTETATNKNPDDPWSLNMRLNYAF